MFKIYISPLLITPLILWRRETGRRRDNLNAGVADGGTVAHLLKRHDGISRAALFLEARHYIEKVRPLVTSKDCV